MSLDLISATGLGAIGPRIIGNLVGAANPYQHYRPLPGVPALDPSCLLAPLPAWLTVDAKLIGDVSMQDGKPVWYGGFDPSLTQPGDYLVGVFGTFFIATQTLPMPISLRYCNIVFTHEQYGAQVTGPSSRGGDSIPSVVVADSFPAWLKSSERRSTPEMQNPGEVALPSGIILLPVSMPAPIQRNDLLNGNDGSSWTVQSADLSASGWSVVAVKSAA